MGNPVLPSLPKSHSPAERDDELVRFVGYQRRSNSMGNYRDSEDPMVAVHPDRTYPRGWMTSDVSNR